MRRGTIGMSFPLILALLLGLGCTEDPPVRLTPVIDLLELTPAGRAPAGWEAPAVKRQAWNFTGGLPDGWTAGPDGVRVVNTGDGIRLESDDAEPWLELRRDIDPLFYDRLVINLIPLADGNPELQSAFHQPGRYRPYGSRKLDLGPVGKPQSCQFKIVPPNAAGSVIRSIRFRTGGSGVVEVRRAALVPRPRRYISGRVLREEFVPLAQEFKRCWRLTEGAERQASFTVPGPGAWLGFDTGTLVGTGSGRFIVELDAGGGWKELHSDSMPQPDEGWLSERVDLSRWAEKAVTVRIRVEAEDPLALHLIGAPTVFATDEETRPNVILILVDTLRSDHLSAYGHHQFTSPTLDRLARQGLLFTAATAPASWTIPSVAATLTGRYPGSVSIGHGRLAGVPAGTPTMAGLLGDAGYSTAGFAANALLDVVRGFHRGFGHYFFSPYTDNQFTAEELNRRALTWIERHGEERFFCFLHYMDPHNPYDPPPFHPDPEDPDSPSAWQMGHVRALIAGDVTVDRPEDLERISDFYDEEIRYVDRQIGLLIARLRQQGLLENTVIVISADHGEELHDRGGWGHGFTLFEELIHVPLIVRLPDRMNSAPGLADTPVSLVDILPTVAALAGIAFPHQTLPGISLLHPSTERFLRSGIWSNRAPGFYAVSHGPWKHIYLDSLPQGGGAFRNRTRLGNVKDAAGAESFYDLRSDPGELRNLAGEVPETETMLREEMARWLAEMNAAPSPGQGETITIDHELEEKLRAMGYMK